MNHTGVSNSTKGNNLKKMNSNASNSKHISNDLDKDKDQSYNETLDKYTLNSKNGISQVNQIPISEMINNLTSKNAKLKNSYNTNLNQENNSIDVVKKPSEVNINFNLSRPILNNNLKVTNFHSKRLASLHVNTQVNQVNSTENTSQTAGLVTENNSNQIKSNKNNSIIKNFYIPAVKEKSKETYFAEEKELSNSLGANKIDHSAKISDIISHFKKAISEVQLNNKSLMSKFTSNNPNIKSFCELNKTCFYSITEKDNLIKDTYYESKVFHQYRAYLKRKQEVFHSGNKQLFSTFKDEQQGTLSDDIVCVICNDGDYEEDNLIVYCAVS